MAFIVTAVTATEAAIAIGSISSIATAVSAVGAAMTVVGTITKAKELTSIGSKLALAGGVTSLVNGAVTGLTGAAAAEGAASGAAGAADAAGADSLVTGASDALGGTAASTGSSGIINAAQNAGKGFDLTSANFGVDNSLMAGAAPTVSTAGATDFSGAVKAATPSLSVPGQTIDDYAAGLGVNPISSPAGDVGATAATSAAAGGSSLDALKAKFGATWDSFSPTTKAELLKAGLSIPGAIQKQRNDQALLDLNQQRINQTSHGSQVPTFGIIQRAQKGGV